MRRPWLWLFSIVVALAAIVVAIRLTTDATPGSDFALIDIQVLNALRSLQPLGPYSRFGWNHPGPIYFQILAPLYWLSGYRHLSTIVMAAIINGGALTGILLVIRRYAKDEGLLIGVTACFGAYVWRAPGLLSSAWNAHVPILPLALLVTMAAATVSGAWALMPLVVLVASFAIQTHLGLTLSALSVVSSVAAVIAWEVMRSSRAGTEISRERRRAVIAAVAVGALVWALPLTDEFRPGGAHNLRAIAEFFQSQPPGDSRMLGRAFGQYFVGFFAHSLRLPWGAIIWPDSDPAIEILAEIQAALLVAAVWWYRRRPFERALAALTLIASIAAFISVRRLPSRPNNHAVFWISVLGVMSWSLIAAAPTGIVLRWLDRRQRLQPLLRRWIPALAVLLIAVAAFSQIRATQREFVRDSTQVERLMSLVRAEVNRTGVRNPLFHVSQDSWAVTAGVVLQLYRGDTRPTVDTSATHLYGRPLATTGLEPLAFRLSNEADHLADYRHRSDHDLLGDVRGLFAYVVRPPPPAAPLDRALTLVSTSGNDVMDAARIVDAVWKPNAAGQLPPMAVFAGVKASATLAMPNDPVIGVRVWGQQGLIWDLSCTRDGVTFEPIGRVRTPDGADPAPGNVYLRDLAGCRQLRIQPFDNNGAWSMSEIQLLVPAPGR